MALSPHALLDIMAKVGKEQQGTVFSITPVVEHRQPQFVVLVAALPAVAPSQAGAKPTLAAHAAGGDVVAHSKVNASHGLSPAIGPIVSIERLAKVESTCARLWARAAVADHGNCCAPGAPNENAIKDLQRSRLLAGAPDVHCEHASPGESGFP